MATSSKQIVLITGANQGIGFEIAKKLANEQPNYHILIGSRTLSKGQSATSSLSSAPATVSAIEVDVSSDHSIDACVAQIDKEFGKLDVLINNAGIGSEAVRDIPLIRGKMARIMDTNVMSSAQMTQSMILLLGKATTTPRIVFITSEMGSLYNTLNPDWQYYPFATPSMAYKASKATKNIIGTIFTVRFREKGWKVNYYYPGLRLTNFNKSLGMGGDPSEGALNAVKLATSEDGETGTFTNIEGTQPW